MGNITLAVPNELLERMRQHSDIRWSEIARRAIAERIDAIETLDRICAKSKLTDKDVEELSAKIKKGAAKRFLAARP